MENNTPLKRITLSSIWQYLTDILTFERGLFYTIGQLAIRPGKAIHHFLYEDRTKLVRPLKFVIYLVTIGSLIAYYLLSFEGGVDPRIMDLVNNIDQSDTSNFNPSKIKATLTKISEFQGKYLNILMLISIPLISIVSYFFYKKFNHNFAEHLVINAYVIGFTNFIIILAYLFRTFFPNIEAVKIEGVRQLLTILYFVFAYYSIFKLPFIKGIFMAIGAIFVSFFIILAFFNSAIFFYFYQTT